MARPAPKDAVERVLIDKPRRTSRSVFIGVCEDCGKTYLKCTCKVYMSALRHEWTVHPKV